MDGKLKRGSRAQYIGDMPQLQGLRGTILDYGGGSCGPFARVYFDNGETWLVNPSLELALVPDHNKVIPVFNKKRTQTRKDFVLRAARKKHTNE